MRKIVLAVVAISSLALSACSTQQAYKAEPGPKEQSGALIGAVAGGILGNQVGGGKGKVAATATGFILGAMIGSSVGQQLDELDRLKHQSAGQQAFERGRTNVPVAWNNPDSGNYGAITPTKTYQKQGRYCREYQQTITIGGEKKSAYGTACRMPDGTWQTI